MSDFRFETSQLGDDHLVRLFGDFDITGFKQLDEELGGIQSNGRPTVTLDLRELTFIDSSGIRVILRADARARALGERLRLIAGPDRVQKVFQITRLDDQLEFVDPGD
jgi:anti-sigma B factor antagonist